MDINFINFEEKQKYRDYLSKNIVSLERNKLVIQNYVCDFDAVLKHMLIYMCHTDDSLSIEFFQYVSMQIKNFKQLLLVMSVHTILKI